MGVLLVDCDWLYGYKDFSCDQAAPRMAQSVRPSHNVKMFPSSYHHEIYRIITIGRRDVHENAQCQKSKVKVTYVKTNLALFWVITDHNSSFDLRMAMKWCTKLEVG